MHEEFKYGIQVFSKKPLDLDDPKLFTPTPYVSIDATNYLIEKGVLFYRDSDHPQCAFFEEFKGEAFYTQLFVNEKTGKILNSIMENKPATVEWVKADAIKRQLHD